jgi:hypothetical protein
MGGGGILCSLKLDLLILLPLFLISSLHNICHLLLACSGTFNPLGFSDLSLSTYFCDRKIADLLAYHDPSQAVAPELTFYDSTKWPAGGPRRERVLRANLDCYIM